MKEVIDKHEAQIVLIQMRAFPQLSPIDFDKSDKPATTGAVVSSFSDDIFATIGTLLGTIDQRNVASAETQVTLLKTIYGSRFHNVVFTNPDNKINMSWTLSGRDIETMQKLTRSGDPGMSCKYQELVKLLDLPLRPELSQYATRHCESSSSE